MAVSGARAVPEINLDEFERRLRAAAAPHSAAEDPLVELARLVDTSKRPGAPARFAPTQAAAPEPTAAAAAYEDAPAEADFGPLRSGFAEDEAGEPYPESVGAGLDPEAAIAANEIEAAPRRRSRGWAWGVSLLAIAGVAMLGGAFVVKSGLPGLPKKPPLIEASQAPIKVQPPSEETVQTAADAGALLLKDGGAAKAPVKVVNTEEQPVDLDAKTSGLAPIPAANPPAAAPSPAPASPVAATDNPPIVAPSNPLAVASPPAVAPLFPDPKPVRTVSLRPDGTPVASAPPAAAEAAPPAPAKPAPAAAAAPPSEDALAALQPATPKLDLPAKPKPKSSARVAIAKTDTTVPPGAATETPSAPLQLGSAPKPDKATKRVKPASEATDAVAATAAAPPKVAAAEPAAPAAPAATPAAGDGDWAVQLAAPRSEGEAAGAVSRLKSKYAGALSGADLTVHKASVNGATIYRVRATGLSKADAAALCGKIKAEGGDCFLAK